MEQLGQFWDSLRRSRSLATALIAYGALALAVPPAITKLVDEYSLSPWIPAVAKVIVLLGAPLLVVFYPILPRSPDGSPPHSGASSGSSSGAGTSTAAPPSSPGNAQSFVSGGRPGRRGVLLGLVALALGLGVVGWVLARSGDKQKQYSLAVLPFDYSPGDSGEVQFAKGMTEQLIAELTSLDGFEVLSLAAVAPFREEKARRAGITDSLNVNLIIEGAVVHSGKQVRVTIRVAQRQQRGPEAVVFTETYFRTIGDPYEVQRTISDEIAHDIQRALHPNRTLAYQSVADTVPAEAALAYHYGRFYWWRRTPKDFVVAIKYFDKAIQLDSSYAAAYAAKADSYVLLAVYNALPPAIAIAAAREAAVRACDLSPDNSMAMTSLAHIRWLYDWKWQEAEQLYLAAIQRDSLNYDALHFYGWYLSLMGRSDTAIHYLMRAQRVNPASSIINADLGLALSRSGNTDQGIMQLQRTLESNPEFEVARVFLGLSLLMAGARNEATEVLDQTRNNPLAIGWRSYALAVSGSPDAATQLLDRLSRDTAFVPAIALARGYAGLDDKEKSLYWLRLAVERREPAVAWLHVDFTMLTLYEEPRFLVLLQQIGLPSTPAVRIPVDTLSRKEG